MLFWIAAVLIAALGALPVLAALFRPGGGREAAHDMAIYRDQLTEIDRDLSRGVLTEDEADRTRAEVSRRLLEADRRGARRMREASKPVRLVAAGLVAVAVMAGGLAIYRIEGAPGYPDLPLRARLADADSARAARLSQPEAEARAQEAGALPEPVEPGPEFADLMERLRTVLEERPDDPQGLRLLAANEARLGNFGAAREAQERLVEVLGDDAPADAYAYLGELMVMNAGGYISPEAEAQFAAALQIDPRNTRALYFIGLSYAQTGRPDRTFGIWRPLLESAPADAPWVAAIRAQIGEVAARAGVEYEAPAAPVGPTAEDMAAAAQMSPEDRQQMVEGMVARLSERLATEGGAAPEWARLIAALGVLGDTERATAIYGEAQQVFANQPEDLALIEEAADQAGVAQ
ncbi:c-type cytochrome biogenesis protein CcmI [Palleronia sp.]|uniref:c-type cytochrome biogenesis protein CcmI n=1 Tax=Palleronia sp. TaxID=1940284 RepID=UPI0035C85F5A